MKYIILKNKELFKSNIYKYVLVYYFITLLYFLLNKSVLVSGEVSVKFCLGLESVLDSSSIEIIMKATLISLIVYLTYTIYSFDIINNSQYIYLRTNSKKILLLNISMVLLYIFFIRIILLLILSIFIKISFDVIVLDILFSFFISLLSFLFLNTIMLKNNGLKGLFFIISIVSLIISFIYINYIYLIIMCIIYLVIIFYINSPQRTIDFFMNS